MNRRDLLRSAIGLLALPSTAAIPAEEFAAVVPGRSLRFPDDEGAHPEFRTEWWYVTGWLDTASLPLGFQVTFFRTRPHADPGNPSRFSPRHILIAHAAISDQARGKLLHEQRTARAGFGLAEARVGTSDVWIDDWSLRAHGTAYATSIRAKDFALELDLQPTQPPLLQGEQGFSRKGPALTSASYYYSFPHLAVRGRVRLPSGTREVKGLAWFDHEWSSQYLDSAAVGWDWMGANLDDGGALMAFRMRRPDGGTHWAGGTLRSPGGKTTSFAPEDVSWRAERLWRSPRTGASYPVSVHVRVGDTSVNLIPLMDDQENDTRISTGAVYWEGAVTATMENRRVGRGYLELTGYAKPLRF